MSNNESLKNALTLIFLALIWGSSYILMKKGLEAFSPVQVAALRLIISAIVLTPFLRKIDKKDIKALLLVAFLGTGIPAFLYPLAITQIDSSLAGIINSLTPVFTVFFGIIWFGAKMRKIQLIGLLVSLMGALLLILYGKSGLGKVELNAYVLIAVMAPIFYGFSSNILKSKLNHISALPLTAVIFYVLLPPALLMLWQSNFMYAIQTEPKAFVALGYISVLSILGTAIALVFFNVLIKKTSAVYASSVTFLMPIVVLIWGVLAGENIGWIHLIGLSLILIGVYVLNYLRKQ